MAGGPPLDRRFDERSGGAPGKRQGGDRKGTPDLGADENPRLPGVTGGPGANGAGTAGTGRAQETLDGTLDRVLFQNATTQWTVARLIPAASPGSGNAAGEAVTVVGPLGDEPEGTPVRLYGTWETNPRYGRQFRVASYQFQSPETLTGIERYLGSGLIPGIGPELAKRIVARFGLRTLDVLNEDPRKLKGVDGIGSTRVEKIADAWEARRDQHDVMVFLRTYGVSSAYAARIYKRYGRSAVELVRDNPYRLALDIWGIGFKTADAIAGNLGLARDAPERIEAGIIHALGKLAEDGHVHVPESTLMETTASLLDVDHGLVPPALDRLESSGLTVREALGDRGTCVYLTELWESEHDAAAAFAELVSTPMRPVRVDLPAALGAFERKASLALTPEQRHAIEAAVMDKCVVITGGPGVGKTTIVRAVVHLFTQVMKRRVALAAPTGRAAKRLGESTGGEAMTLHRLLEFQPRANSFFRNGDNPLEDDVVVVDEVSMVDISLFRALLAALPSSAQLVLVGDVDQLPSVGPGAVLADVIESGAATVVRLTKIFRQAAASRIITAAHEINQGIVPPLDPPSGSDAHRSDFYFIGRSDPVKARETIVDLVAERIPDAFGFDAIADIQVLCPIHRGDLGTIALNQAMQDRLNPGASGVPEIVRAGRVFRAGDKVMQLRNDYDRSVFNGDIGILLEIVGNTHKAVVDFLDGRVVVYEQGDLDQLTHAYAISVHKSQGSEYPVVIIPLVTQHYMMLQRNLLYTGVTRGKRLVVLIGSRKAVSMATENSMTAKRWTWLAERIRASARMDDPAPD